MEKSGKSMITKKSDGSQVKEKESTDSSTTLEDEEVKGKLMKFLQLYYIQSVFECFYSFIIMILFNIIIIII
jgi:hypothetical protein